MPDPQPCEWENGAPDTQCHEPATTAVTHPDDGPGPRLVCTTHHAAAVGQGWAVDSVTADHPDAYAYPAEAIARFRALSDAAGNPGAPRPTPGACICGPRGDGTGPYDGDPDPDCPEHGHVYGAAVDPSVFGHGMFAGYTTGPAPGPGVNDVAEMARAAASHYGPGARPGELLSDGLNRIGAKLDAIHALVHGLPHPAVLAQIHERLDRIEYVTENIAAAVDDPTPADRTLSAMGRVTDWDRTDTEHVIASVLTEHLHQRTLHDIGGASDLAQAIAQALYGPTTETTPGRGEEEPWPMCAHCGRTLRDCDCPPFEVTDEGAPTEGDPLPDDIDDIAADPDRQDEIPYPVDRPDPTRRTRHPGT